VSECRSRPTTPLAPCRGYLEQRSRLEIVLSSHQGAAMSSLVYGMLVPNPGDAVSLEPGWSKPTARNACRMWRWLSASGLPAQQRILYIGMTQKTVELRHCKHWMDPVLCLRRFTAEERRAAFLEELHECPTPRDALLREAHYVARWARQLWEHIDPEAMRRGVLRGGPWSQATLSRAKLDDAIGLGCLHFAEFSRRVEGLAASHYIRKHVDNLPYGSCSLGAPRPHARGAVAGKPRVVLPIAPGRRGKPSTMKTNKQRKGNPPMKAKAKKKAKKTGAQWKREKLAALRAELMRLGRSHAFVEMRCAALARQMRGSKGQVWQQNRT
jgi:hypothetical protein